MGKGQTFFLLIFGFWVQSFHVHPIQSKVCGDSNPYVSEVMISCWLIYNLRCLFLLLEVDQWDNTKHDVHEQLNFSLEMQLVQELQLVHKMPMQW
jgi:hypothetical protein